MDLKDKKVLLIGMGLSGNSSLRLLQAKGALCDVYDSKENPAIDEHLLAGVRERFTGGSKPDFQSLDYDMVVVSPGVPTKKGIIKEARDAGLKIIGELELAYQFAKGSFIAITGTNGKTTTTTWVHDLFERAGLNAHLAGNVGIPLSDVVLEHESEDDIYICELSSYQLESIVHFKPIIAAILNVTPDHLARHGTMEAYAEAKYDIAKNMDKDGVLILNIDNDILSDYYTNGDFNYKVISFSKYDESSDVNAIKNKYQIGLKGEHNLENALALIAIAKAYGIDDKYVIESLREFKGVAHRNEFLGTINGVSYYNDSKATNPEAAIPALKSIDEDVVLIAGGMDKGNDYGEWIENFTKVKFVCLFGETKNDIAKSMEEKGLKNYKILENLDEAFKLAIEKAETGDAILLSPACASWDMYKSFEERGDHFRRLVEGLGKGSE